MSLGTKIFSFISMFLLISASLGSTAIDFYLIKLVVFVSAFYLAVVAYRTKEYFWLVLFVVVAFLFAPIKGFLIFSYLLWRIIDVIVSLIFALFIYRYYDSYRKGSAFEKFVSSLFPKETWAIEDWTKDKSRGLKRDVESDRNPDLTLRNLNTGGRFAVECKFRSRFWMTKFGTGIFWDKYRHDFYKNYGNKEKVKVIIAFGVGGNPKNPARLFIVPIEELEEYKGKIIPAQFLHKFEKDTKTTVSF